MDPNPEFWEGKRGACAGSLLAVIVERPNGAPPDRVNDICTLLRGSNNQQAEAMLRAIRRYITSTK